MTNCLLNYAPDWSLSIDEQLFPIKNRCLFIVYKPNKPEKFGMKFWMLPEIYSKYVYKILPYLRALKERKSREMGDHLQEMCCEIGPKHPQPRRITSLQVSTLLLEKKISMVGTVRTNSKGLTKFMTKNDNELHKSSFYSMMAKRSYVLITCARKRKS